MDGISGLADKEIDHSNIGVPLWNTEEMCAAPNRACRDVVQLPHLDYLGPHQLVLIRHPSAPLRPQPWRPERTREKVLFPISYLLLIPHWPVPENGGRAFQPLKPTGIGAPPQNVQTRADGCPALPGASE